MALLPRSGPRQYVVFGTLQPSGVDCYAGATPRHVSFTVEQCLE
jgi:hypothetical protein